MFFLKGSLLQNSFSILNGFCNLKSGHCKTLLFSIDQILKTHLGHENVSSGLQRTQKKEKRK